MAITRTNGKFCVHQNSSPLIFQVRKSSESAGADLVLVFLVLVPCSNPSSVRRWLVTLGTARWIATLASKSHDYRRVKKFKVFQKFKSQFELYSPIKVLIISINFMLFDSCFTPKKRRLNDTSLLIPVSFYTRVFPFQVLKFSIAKLSSSFDRPR